MTLYADGPNTEATVTVQAGADRVWDLVSDISTPSRFSEELQRVEWADDVGARVGATFHGFSTHPRVGEWQSTSYVTGYEPHALFEWSVSDPDTPAAIWRFTMNEGSDPNTTRLTFWAQLGPAPSGLTPAIKLMPDKEEQIVARRLQEHNANMVRTLEGIKALAEAPSPR